MPQRSTQWGYSKYYSLWWWGKHTIFIEHCMQTLHYYLPILPLRSNWLKVLLTTTSSGRRQYLSPQLTILWFSTPWEVVAWARSANGWSVANAPTWTLRGKEIISAILIGIAIIAMWVFTLTALLLTMITPALHICPPDELILWVPPLPRWPLEVTERCKNTKLWMHIFKEL